MKDFNIKHKIFEYIDNLTVGITIDMAVLNKELSESEIDKISKWIIIKLISLRFMEDKKMLAVVLKDINNFDDVKKIFDNAYKYIGSSIFNKDNEIDVKIHDDLIKIIIKKLYTLDFKDLPYDFIGTLYEAFLSKSFENIAKTIRGLINEK